MILQNILALLKFKLIKAGKGKAKLLLTFEQYTIKTKILTIEDKTSIFPLFDMRRPTPDS